VNEQERDFRRVTRGSIELRRQKYWNRYRAEQIDVRTGAIRRCQLRMLLGAFRSRAAAAAALDRYLAILQSEVLQPGPTVTLREYAARFDRLAIALMRPESQRGYRGTYRNHLEPAMGDKPLVAIDATVLQEMIATLHAKGLARSTIETIRNRLLHILRHARAAGFSAHAIARSSVRMPSEQRAEVERRHITGGELDQILKASSGARHALWAILGFAGLRIGEACGLSWRNIDLQRQTILVRQAAVGGVIAPLKTRTAHRDVPMLPPLVQILTAYRAEMAEGSNGLLFSSRRGKPIRSDDVRRRWLRPLLTQLGIPAAGCHAFRHGLPGRLDELGLSPAAIQRFMGHSTLTMTERYLHRSTNDLREQLAAALKRQSDRQGATP
jgi:integrase